MADTETSGGPTQKMVDFAEGIAKRLGLAVDPLMHADFAACKAFIDAHKEAASLIPFAPSEKQLKFATSIAEKKALVIPAATLASGKELSLWIDANKG